MLEAPKFSIVTPNLNGDAYLEEAIVSVLSQNYSNLEYIIIDGGSSDGSIEIIRKYEKHLAYWVSEPDEGLYSALQKGFDRATGHIMAWINSDDMYHPGAFDTVSEIFQSLPQVHWLTGPQTIFDSKGRTVAVRPSPRWVKHDFYQGNYKWIQQESTFWTRSLWQRAGSRFCCSMRYAGDFELWLRFFRSECLFTTSALLGGFRVTGQGQLSVAFHTKYLDEAEELLAKEILSEEDKDIMRRRRRAEKLKHYLAWLPAIVADRLTSRIVGLSAEKSPQVKFDRETMRFLVI